MKKETNIVAKQEYECCKSEFRENVDNFYKALRLNKNALMIKYNKNAIKSGKRALKLGKSLEMDTKDVKGMLGLITSHNKFLQFTPNIRDHFSAGILINEYKDLYN